MATGGLAAGTVDTVQSRVRNRMAAEKTFDKALLQGASDKKQGAPEWQLLPHWACWVVLCCPLCCLQRLLLEQTPVAPTDLL